MPGVLLHALIGIGADLAGEGDEVGPLWRKPFVEQVVRKPLPQPDLDHLAQPGLRNHQHQKAADDDHEDEKLKAERRDVLLFERIVEVAVPAVQPDLSDGVRADDESEAYRQQSDAVSSPRNHECAQQ